MGDKPQADETLIIHDHGYSEDEDVEHEGLEDLIGQLGD